MPVQLLSPGMPWTMLANQVYALPAVKCTLFTDAAAPTLTIADDATFTTNVALTLAAGQATVAGGFIKATADTLVILKRD